MLTVLAQACKRITPEGLCITEDGSEIATFRFLETIFGNVVGILIGLGRVIFFIMLIVGGFNYMSAGGDPKQIEGASKTLTYAVGGMILLALSLLIFRVIEAFTGVDLLKFTIELR